MTKFEDLKRLAAARTQGEWATWPEFKPCEIYKIRANKDDLDNLDELGWFEEYLNNKSTNAGNNAYFVVVCANNIDKLLAVVEEAKQLVLFYNEAPSAKNGQHYNIHALEAALAALEEESK